MKTILQNIFERKSKISIHIYCWIFPLFWMRELVFSWGTLQMKSGNITAPRNVAVLADADGGVRLAWLLSKTRWPWSSLTNVSFPTGESLWRLQNVSQGIQIVVLWALSHVLSPIASVNTFIYLGWALSGSMVYLLCKHLQLGYGVSLLAGLLVQSLPSLRFSGVSYTSYMYVCVPIAVYLTASRLIQTPTWRSSAQLCAVLVLPIFFDIYWFYFSAIPCLFFLLTILRKGAKQAGTKYLMAPLIFGALIIFCLNLVSNWQRAESGSISRPIEIASLMTSQINLRSISNWFFGASAPGVLFLCCGLWSMVVVYRNRKKPGKNERVQLFLVFSIAFLFLLSTNVLGNFLNSNFNLSAWLRLITPGLRFFDRAAILMEALTCVAIAVALDIKIAGRENGIKQKSKMTLLSALLILPLVQKENLTMRDNWSVYNPARSEINSNPNAVVLGLPFLRRGRDWLEQGHLEMKFFNGMYSKLNQNETELCRRTTQVRFFSYLKWKKITDILLVTDSKNPNEYANFNIVGRGTGVSILPFGEDGVMTMNVVHLPLTNLDGTRGSCRVAEITNWSNIVDVFGENYTAEGRSPSRNWWAYGPISTVTPASEIVQAANLEGLSGSISFNLGINPCELAQEIEVHFGREMYRVHLDSTNAERKIEILFDGKHPLGPVSLVSLGKRVCQIPTDVRSFQYRVSEPHIRFDDFGSP